MPEPTAWYSDPTNWMGAGVGVSALGDIYGIISAQRQQARMRQIYNLLMNPSALAANVNALYTPLSEASQKEIARFSQGEMGMRGLGDSQFATLHAARAYAGIEAEQRNRALAAYMDALGSATRATGAPYGSTGAFGRSLGSMAQIMAMRQARDKEGEAPGVAATPRSSLLYDPLALRSSRDWSNYSTPTYLETTGGYLPRPEMLSWGGGTPDYSWMLGKNWQSRFEPYAEGSVE